MKVKSEILLLLTNLLCYTQSYKILVCYPLNVKSMNSLGEAAVRHLLNDGHEVTFITTFPSDVPQHKHYREIQISDNNVIFNDQKFSIKYVLENKIKETDISSAQEFARENAKIIFKNENLTKLLKNMDEHFDAVIVDLLELEVYAGLAVLYNCPMIWLYSMGAHWQALRLIGESPSPAYDTDFIGTDIPPFTFAQRLKELWSRMQWILFKTFVTAPIEHEIYKQTFEPLLTIRGRKLPDYEEVVFNSSLMFGNEHNAVHFRPSTPQNFKYIGGFHIKDPVKPLPKDLQYIMDNATHGVIYFSMGSFWKSKELPISLTRALLDMFGKLKQTVIWKYEDDFKDLPNNVHLIKWVPQQSVLAHPNCKIFISHGGLLSTTESIHFGVPIIGIPVLYDQFNNINRASKNGYCIRIDLNYDLPENLHAAIKLMLTDTRFSMKVKEISSVYHDRPMKPGSELAFWVRHVVKTGGAPHLRSPAVNVPFYQRLYLDFIALVLLICFILFYALNMISKKIYKKTFKILGKYSEKKKK